MHVPVWYYIERIVDTRLRTHWTVPTLSLALLFMRASSEIAHLLATAMTRNDEYLTGITGEELKKTWFVFGGRAINCTIRCSMR